MKKETKKETKKEMPFDFSRALDTLEEMSKSYAEFRSGLDGDSWDYSGSTVSHLDYLDCQVDKQKSLILREIEKLKGIPEENSMQDSCQD